MVDELIPSVTTEVLAGLLKREQDERFATQDLVWEAKEELSKFKRVLAMNAHSRRSEP